MYVWELNDDYFLGRLIHLDQIWINEDTVAAMQWLEKKQVYIDSKKGKDLVIVLDIC